MISSLWNAVLYKPLYNGLVFLMGVMPFYSVGLSIITLTILVRLAIFPVSHKSIKTQRKMRELEPEIRAIRGKYKDKQEQAKATMELYKKHGTNPFSGCLTIFIQLPVLIALFLVFRNGFVENHEILYSFVSYPPETSSVFLGIDLHQKSYILALLVGLSQFLYTSISLPKPSPLRGGTFQEEFSRSMNIQMRYFFPVLFVVFSMGIPSAVALYWLTSNIFSIIQELVVKKAASSPEEEMSPKT